MRQSSSPSLTGIDALVEASASLRNRPIAARLSASFPYKEYRALRSARSAARPDQKALRRASFDVQIAAGKKPTASQQHTLGVAYLLLEAPGRARLELEAALRQETRSSRTLTAIRASTNAELLNDLSAAYQTLLTRSELYEWRAFAVEASQRAWSLKKSPQIAFTRALAIEPLHVRESAIAAWTNYLAIDAGSPWSVEARERLKELQEPTEAELWPDVRDRLVKLRDDHAAVRVLVDRNRQSVRLWCEDELLPGWGDTVLRGDSGGVAMLSTIAVIGEALRESNGEHDVIDAVQAIRRASDSGRLRLARGHAAYGRGRKAIVAVEAQKALREMEVAVANLEPPITPFAERARIEHAAAVYLTNDYQRVLHELEALPPAPESHAAAGRVEWVRGLTRAQMGGPELAIAHYRRALESFRHAGESDFECMIHSLLAWALENSGNSAEADGHRDRAMRILMRTGNRDRSHVVVFEAAYAAIARDTPELADVMLDAVVARDVATGSSFYACNSLMWRGAYRYRRGLRRAAAEDLLLARRFCNAIDDPQARARGTANVGLAFATVDPGRTTANDLHDLDVAVAYFKEQKIARWLRTAYVARARALADAGSPEAAERDFLAALNEIGSIRKQIDARDARVSFTATADDIADAYVEFLLKQRRERDAFEVADRNRVRELVDAPGARWSNDGRTPVIARVQHGLPDTAALIEYRVLGDTIVVWLLRGSTLSTRKLSCSPADIGVLLQRMNGEATDAELRAAGTALYDALLRPIAEWITTARSLVIVPDGDLEHVPFAALYDASRRRYVVESQATVMASSAALHLQSASRFRDRSGREDEVVVVEAASSGDDVTALPEARREARAVAVAFPRARIVSGSDALRAAPSATCLHFCGHGVREDGGSIRALRLGEGESGRLAPSQIASLDLPVTRLVYLSACDTDTGPVLRSEGGVTAARAFFAAGVPVVIGTLWQVDDGVARDVARRFYERLRAGDSPAEALRNAQSTLMSSGTSARSDWAAFRVLGGGN
jgi:CHAT domain-containing protein